MKMNREKNTVKNITVMGLLLAFTCILSAIPLGINILGVAATLQTFAIAFAGFVLGAKRGAAVAALYVVMGLIIPVYSNMTSGPGILFGPTGGFLFGFIIMAGLCGATWRFNNFLARAGLAILGLIACHGLGLLQFVLVIDMDFAGAMLAVTLPYLPKDILMTGLAWVVAQPVRRSLKQLMKN